MKKRIFSDRSFRRLFKREKARAVSDKAVIKMRELVENYSSRLAGRAVRNALFSGRKTIKKEDVRAE